MSNLVISGYEPFVIVGRSTTSVGHIAPAATFTNAAPSSASGGTKTTLTSAGAHGLTAAVAVGKTLNITAGTGWTAGFYNISSIDLDTTGVAITIDVAYDAGMGAPTIILVGANAVHTTVTLPSLNANSIIEIDATWNMASNTNVRIPLVKLDGTSFYAPQISSAAAYVRPSSIVIQNNNATNAQISSFSTSNSLQSGTTTGISTGSIDTSVATSLTFGGQVATANDFIYITRYIVKVYP